MSTLSPTGPSASETGLEPDLTKGSGGSDGGSRARRGAGAGRPRRRVALWLSLGAAAVVGVLIAVLATSQPAAQVLTDSPLLGKPAPQIVGRAILNGPAGGGQVELSSYRGRWVLVNFAASWCVPCQEEMPQLLLFARQHQVKHDATILTVAYDQNDIGNLRRFLTERSVTWPAVDESSASITWGVNGLPQSYLVDPRGSVVAVVEGQADAADLDALITKYSPQAAAGS